MKSVPYIPFLDSEIDTSNFDEFEPMPLPIDDNEDNDKDDMDLAFMGFKYKNDYDDAEQTNE